MKISILLALCLLVSPVWAQQIVEVSRAGNVALVRVEASSNRSASLQVELWSLRPWTRLRPLSVNLRRWTGVTAFSSDGRLIAFGFADSTIEIYETKRGKLWARLGRPQNLAGAQFDYYEINALAFSGDRKTLAWANTKGLFLWNVSAKKLRFSRPLSIELFKDYVRKVDVELLQFSPDGKTIAIGGGSQFPVLLYDIARKRVRLKLQLHAEDGRATAVSFSPGGNRLLVASYYNVSATAYDQLHMFDTRSGEVLWRWNNRSDKPDAYATAAVLTRALFASDGRRFAVGNESFLEIRSAQSGRLLLARGLQDSYKKPLAEQKELLPELAVR